MAKKVLRTLQDHTRVPCGFAAVNDIRTGKQEDRLDSFVMSETLKYMYLIFAEPSEIDLDLDAFIFTTEAHLLPLSLGQLGNITRTSGESKFFIKFLFFSDRVSFRLLNQFNRILTCCRRREQRTNSNDELHAFMS